MKKSFVMKISKIALECLFSLAVTGVLAVVVLLGLLGSEFVNGRTKAKDMDYAQRSSVVSAEYSLDTVCEIQPYDQNLFENKSTNSDEGIMAMECPGFQETVEKMRQLTPEEIHDMYEYYKNKTAE